MDAGTYTAVSGGCVQFRKLEVVNNNLANVNTPGFKRQVLVGDVQTFDQTLAALQTGNPYAEADSELTPIITSIETKTDFTPGAIRATGNPLDAALRKANDFFVINMPDGPRYTRAGNFTLSNEGTLVTQDGFPVQGDGGPITVTGPNVTITPAGDVKANGQLAGRIQVVRITDPQQLERTDGSRFRAPDGTAVIEAVAADIEPAALEMSNVSAISGVIDLITANRAFQMYAKSLETLDTLNSSAIGQLGRVR